MKKRIFTNKLALKKKVIAALDAKRLTGGTVNAEEDPLTHNSLCPIETCSCSDPKFDNCKPIRN
ncbi:MAG: class I lanthipeptide [Bacteroidota bacterium]